jgi:hypothetical protein
VRFTIVPFRNGAISAVKPAATTKNASKPMKIHDIPLIRRFLFAGAGGI